jgi:hypothetical protein
MKKSELHHNPFAPYIESDSSYVTSRDAYMLIYTLRQGAPSTGASSTAPQGTGVECYVSHIQLTRL